MAFDLGKWDNTAFTHRTEAVPVPDLKAWFAEGDKPEFIVRGLTANELNLCNEALQKRQFGASLVKAMEGGTSADKVRELRAALGFGDDVSGQTAKGHEMVRLGLVEPKLAHDQVVRFAERHPIEFFTLVRTITELSGKGQDPEKKPAPSGKMTRSRRR